MNDELLSTLQETQAELEPRFKAMRAATTALKQATRLAGEEKPDALPMQKALAKLQQAAEQLDDATLDEATAAFEEETQRALDALAFEFARDLKDSFEARGVAVEGRPPRLTVGPLLLEIDTTARKARWFYGKEALTRALPLSLKAIMKAYDQQHRAIVQRDTDTVGLLGELYRAWSDEIESRTRRPSGNRLNLVETYSRVVMNRQTGRFWNAPSRATFKDYPRAHFVRDLVRVQESPTVTVDGTRYRLRLGTATKSQADNPSRSVWVPAGDDPLDGEYYSDITFEEV